MRNQSDWLWPTVYTKLAETATYYSYWYILLTLSGYNQYYTVMVILDKT